MLNERYKIEINKAILEKKKVLKELRVLQQPKHNKLLNFVVV